MNLVLDIGNTRVKAGVFNDNDGTLTESTDDVTSEHLRSILNRLPIARAAICSVRNGEPEWLNELSAIKVHRVTSSSKLPFTSRYATPETLGTDRICLVAGAATLHPGEDVLIVDAGSCITYDFIDGSAVYHGGAISPGIMMRYKALNQFTGKLPLVTKMDKTKLTGDSTEASIASGVLNGAIGEVEGMTSRYMTLHANLKTIITGGDAPYLLANLETRIFAAPNLVLYGLNSILNLNVAT